MSADLSQDQASFVLSPKKMAEADARAVDAGTPETTLIDRAAASVFKALRGRWSRRPVSVLCGPGSNGADGWAIADLLHACGWDVTVHAAVTAARMEGAAGDVARRSRLTPTPLSDVDAKAGRLIIDAMFGAGLNRDLIGVTLDVVRRLNDGAANILSIDLPSGVDGETGQIRGGAPKADLTVTFHRYKPAHLLQPGAALCGDVMLADIGLSDEGEPTALVARSSLFMLPIPGADTHKYARGSVVVASGGHTSSGAARLAANAAAACGAGAVTLASPLGSLDVNVHRTDAVMVRPVREATDLAEIVAERSSAAVLGPGMGRTDATRERTVQVLNLGTPCVLDADALTVFEDDPATLFALLHEDCVLTPHAGEFARLFGAPDLGSGKLAAAQAAAETCGATVVFKGADTVIAARGKVPIIAANGPPWLATAGSGDTLAGMIGALLAQGMSTQAAAAAGAWLHGEAGLLGGPSLTADKLSEYAAQAYAAHLSVDTGRTHA